MAVLGFENESSPRHRKLTHPRSAHATTNHDALGSAPICVLQEAPKDARQRLGKLFDGSVDDLHHFGVALGENSIQPLLADALDRLPAEGVLSFAQWFSPFLEQLAKDSFAGAVADKAVLVLKLQVVGI